MLIPVEWKRVAGYPGAPFCVKHDRFIVPISLTDANGGASWGCPYCAEDETPQPITAKSKEPEHPTMGFYTSSRYSSAVTFWCSEKGCQYHTTFKEGLAIHTRVLHGASDKEKMKCSQGPCDKDAVDFCAQCESAICKDHIDWHDMCPSCGSMYPY